LNDLTSALALRRPGPDGADPASPTLPVVRYRVEIADRPRHQFRVEMTLDSPAADQRLSLPVWIPGSYLVREFSRHLSAIEARQGRQTPAVRALNKNTWQVTCRAGIALRVSYLVYAFDTSVRTAFLDANRGFFNGTSLLLRAEGATGQPHRLSLGPLPDGWQVATAMRPAAGAASVHEFQAADYDELVDHPFELGPFWRGRFEAGGVGHEFVVAGALPTFDGERLLADSRRICAAQIRFWHGDGAAPVPHYVFLLNATTEGRGGLEHRASTALAAPRRDLPRIGTTPSSDGHVDLLGLISHEYFHTWNVKRLKPAEFDRIDYDRENLTELLWFFEGFTSYYDDLMLLRCGLIDPQRYLGLLSRTINQVLATPGRFVQSLAAASFDAWIKYYRADENTPNATVSYYAKGALVALAFDLSLRTGGHRGASLDAVMRRLWQRSSGGAITEDDIAQALAAVGGRPYAAELAQWVHGTATDPPLQNLLTRVGVDWRLRPAGAAAALGLRLSEGPVSGITVQSVLAGSPADRAGVSAGDEVLAIDGWRIRRFDEGRDLCLPGQAFDLTLVRNQRLMTVEMRSDEGFVPAQTVELNLAASADRPTAGRRRAWLHG
jgi:predicted metalloprotease with PDZ domain